MKLKDQDETLSDKSTVVRTVSFHPSVDLMQKLMYLRSKRVTGTLSVDLNQGGIGSIRFREESQIDFE